MVAKTAPETPFTKIRRVFKRGSVWRRGWDSNPRYIAVYLISSQGRYDHFDTSPNADGARVITTRTTAARYIIHYPRKKIKAF